MPMFFSITGLDIPKPILNPQISLARAFRSPSSPEAMDKLAAAHENAGDAERAEAREDLEFRV